MIHVQKLFSLFPALSGCPWIPWILWIRPPLLPFRSYSGLCGTCERCGWWHDLHINDCRRKHPFIYVHKHTHCVFSDARGQFDVVGGLRLWSRCLGSDNIVTETIGVTTFRQEGHTQTHIVYLIGWHSSFFTDQKTAASGDYSHIRMQCAHSCVSI